VGVGLRWAAGAVCAGRSLRGVQTHIRNAASHPSPPPRARERVRTCRLRASRPSGWISVLPGASAPISWRISRTDRKPFHVVAIDPSISSEMRAALRSSRAARARASRAPRPAAAGTAPPRPGPPPRPAAARAAFFAADAAAEAARTASCCSATATSSASSIGSGANADAGRLSASATPCVPLPLGAVWQENMPPGVGLGGEGVEEG
jgi:hypothetical protein